MRFNLTMGNSHLNGNVWKRIEDHQKSRCSKRAGMACMFRETLLIHTNRVETEIEHELGFPIAFVQVVTYYFGDETFEVEAFAFPNVAIFKSYFYFKTTLSVIEKLTKCLYLNQRTSDPASFRNIEQHKEKNISNSTVSETEVLSWLNMPREQLQKLYGRHS